MFSTKNLTRSRNWAMLCLVPALLLALVALITPASNAQQLTGTLSGTVMDSTGAVVPGAQVTLTNQTSGDVRKATADAQGRFVITAVQPADYSLKVEANGFTAWQENGIAMSTGDARDIPNIKLAVGGATATVQVIGGGEAIVPTDTAEISTSLNQKMVDSFPLAGRDAGELLKVMPGMALNNNAGGASKTFATGDVLVGSNNGPVGDYSSNGTQPNGTMAYMLDGADLVDPGNFGTQIANINQDMVGNIKFLSADYSAEYADRKSVV